MPLPLAESAAPQMPPCCPEAALAEGVEVVRRPRPRGVRWGSRATSIDRESTPNDKCIACERTNIAQLMRGCATDFSCHADHMDMRLARRDARIDKCDRHT